MRLRTKLGLVMGAIAIGVMACSGTGGAAGYAVSGSAAPQHRSVAGSYLLDFTVSSGGGASNEPLTLESDGTAMMSTCQGLWTVTGKEFALDINPATCSGAAYLFAGPVTPKGLATEKKPGTFIASFQTSQGVQTDTGTWHATKQ